MPQSRPMPSIAARCHELRVNDEGRAWRLMYRLDPDAILILAVFAKKTEKTPDEIIRICRADSIARRNTGSKLISRSLESQSLPGSLV